jgi:hypothetical protein
MAAPMSTTACPTNLSRFASSMAGHGGSLGGDEPVEFVRAADSVELGAGAKAISSGPSAKQRFSSPQWRFARRRSDR